MPLVFGVFFQFKSTVFSMFFLADMEHASYQIASMFVRLSRHKNFEVLKKFFLLPETFAGRLCSQKIKLRNKKVGILALVENN